jgi:hypothetical protein
VALRGEIVGAYFSGIVARELAGRDGRAQRGEERPVRHVSRPGPHAAVFYLPRKPPNPASDVESRGQAESAAATEVLGVTYAELGDRDRPLLEFPRLPGRSMKPVAEPPSEQPATNRSGSGSLAAFATEVERRSQRRTAGFPRKARRADQPATRALGVGPRAAHPFRQGAAEKFVKESRVLNLPPLSGPLLGSLQALQAGSVREPRAEAPCGLDGLSRRPSSSRP